MAGHRPVTVGSFPATVVVMGPSACGKTTLGRALASAIGFRFVDADDLHSPAAVAKMARGEGLTDGDRWPWLWRLKEVLDEAQAQGGVVLACSALKSTYRRLLESGAAEPAWLFLDVPVAELRRRIERRQGHFAGRALLASQLDTLERPTGAIALDGTLAVTDLVERAKHDLLLAVRQRKARGLHEGGSGA